MRGHLGRNQYFNKMNKSQLKVLIGLIAEKVAHIEDTRTESWKSDTQIDQEVNYYQELAKELSEYFIQNELHKSITNFNYEQNND